METAALGTARDPIAKKVEESIRRLRDPDRWIRCGAAWDLSFLGDRRVCPLLLQACADADVGVSQWAAQGLLRHLNVLPFIEADKSAAFKAAKRGWEIEGLQHEPERNAALLGALSTPESTAKLLELAVRKNAVTRKHALLGLGYDRDPKAFEYLYEQCTRLEELFRIRVSHFRNEPVAILCGALIKTQDSRAMDVLVQWADSPGDDESARLRTASAVVALSSLHTGCIARFQNADCGLGPRRSHRNRKGAGSMPVLGPVHATNGAA